MTINEAMRTYRLPNPTTPEDLECRWSKVLNFGDKVLLAGYYYSGKGKPSYFGAVYEHLDDDMSCEGTIGLRAVSNTEFEDYTEKMTIPEILHFLYNTSMFSISISG